MNKLGNIITIISIILGILLIMLVLKIIMLSSNSMGMMMDKDLIYDHMLGLIKFIAIIIITLILLFWMNRK